MGAIQRVRRRLDLNFALFSKKAANLSQRYRTRTRHEHTFKDTDVPGASPVGSNFRILPKGSGNRG